MPHKKFQLSDKYPLATDKIGRALFCICTYRYNLIFSFRGQSRSAIGQFTVHTRLKGAHAFMHLVSDQFGDQYGMIIDKQEFHIVFPSTCLDFLQLSQTLFKTGFVMVTLISRKAPHPFMQRRGLQVDSKNFGNKSLHGVDVFDRPFQDRKTPLLQGGLYGVAWSPVDRTVDLGKKQSKIKKKYSGF